MATGGADAIHCYGGWGYINCSPLGHGGGERRRMGASWPEVATGRAINTEEGDKYH